MAGITCFIIIHIFIKESTMKTYQIKNYYVRLAEIQCFWSDGLELIIAFMNDNQKLYISFDQPDEPYHEAEKLHQAIEAQKNDYVLL